MAATIEEIQREAKAIQKRMWRARDSNDKAGMIRLKARIAGLKMDLELLREKCCPRFRRSYTLEFWIEALHNGKRKTSAIYLRAIN